MLLIDAVRTNDTSVLEQVYDSYAATGKYTNIMSDSVELCNILRNKANDKKVVYCSSLVGLMMSSSKCDKDSTMIIITKGNVASGSMWQDLLSSNTVLSI